MASPGSSPRTAGCPDPAPRTNHAPSASAITILKVRYAAASSAATASAAAAALSRIRAQATAGRRGCACPGRGPRLPGRLSTAANTPPRVAIQVPLPSRSRPPITPGRSGQCGPGGSHGRSARSSRLAASKSGQAWPGRTKTITVHTAATMPPPCATVPVARRVMPYVTSRSGGVTNTAARAAEMRPATHGARAKPGDGATAPARRCRQCSRARQFGVVVLHRLHVRGLSIAGATRRRPARRRRAPTATPPSTARERRSCA